MHRLAALSARFGFPLEREPAEPDSYVGGWQQRGCIINQDPPCS